MDQKYEQLGCEYQRRPFGRFEQPEDQVYKCTTYEVEIERRRRIWNNDEFKAEYGEGLKDVGLDLNFKIPRSETSTDPELVYAAKHEGRYMIERTKTGSTLAGRAIAANLLKLVPGAGSAAGSAIAATTAAAVTTAFGEAYLATLVKLFGDGNEPSEDEILAEFKRRSARS